ncbi:MAG: hypothetical protein J6X94_10390 [Lachnospiraceae bacterium]|nr:hypothetical protein [Lachnospiraceae bacterium]
MKKRYLALILACFMALSLTMSACGRLADEIVRDEDEDDDDKDDEDEEEDEEEIIYVETIDEDDLEDQIKVIVKNRDAWLVSSDSSAAADSIEYCVADLDHNGRAELISVTRFDYTSLTEVHVYEVDEKGKGLDEAKWKFKGLELTSDKYPDFDMTVTGMGYYDKKKNETHYLIDNFFDNGNMELGTVYCDIKYVDGKITCLNYAAVVHSGDYKYYFDDGTEISDDDEFLDHFIDYTKKYKMNEFYFGLFVRSYSELDKLAGMDDDEWHGIFTASYQVFSGQMTQDEFDDTYNSVEEPDSDGFSYDDLVGSWMLYSSNDGYETEYYDKDSNGYFVIEIFPDMTGELQIFFEDDPLSKELEVYDDDGFWILEMRDPEGEILDEDLDYVQFMIMDMSDDGQDISVYNLVYDKDGFIEEGYEMVFVRDDDSYGSGSSDRSLDRYIGEWELVSSEIEGDVTYYEPNGSFNATLIVSEDGMADLLEYRNGKLDLEIKAEMRFDSVGLPYFGYSDKNALTAPIATETYTLFLNIADYNVMDVFLDFYDEDGDMIGGCILTFEKTS